MQPASSTRCLWKYETKFENNKAYLLYTRQKSKVLTHTFAFWEAALCGLRRLEHLNVLRLTL